MTRECWLRWAAGRGYRIAFGHPGLAAGARQRLAELHRAGQLDPEFYRASLGFLMDRPGPEPADGGTLVLVAVPRPAHVLTFHRNGREQEAVIPPTYVGYRDLFTEVRADAAAACAGPEETVEILKAPLKTLAVLTGWKRNASWPAPTPAGQAGRRSPPASPRSA